MHIKFIKYLIASVLHNLRLKNKSKMKQKKIKITTIIKDHLLKDRMERRQLRITLGFQIDDVIEGGVTN